MCVYVSIFLCFYFFSGVWFIVTVVIFVACTFVTCFNKDQSINQSINWQVPGLTGALRRHYDGEHENDQQRPVLI